MQTIEEQLPQCDRSDWGSGPWDGEPDKVQWLDEDTGLPCLIVRHGSMGHFCAYVGVPKGHVYYGVVYCECALEPKCEEGDWCQHSPVHDLEVHGGLTYSAPCAGDICHKVEPGEDGDVWWLGFDCAHHMDESPGGGALARRLNVEGLFNVGGEYRTVDFVKDECRLLASQLVAVR